MWVGFGLILRALIVPLWVQSLATAARRGVSVPTFSLRPPMLDRLPSLTTYACEGGELHVSCEEGTIIRLIRANYGRFSISICNDLGKLHWSVNCMSYKSFLIMQDRCSQKPSCSVGVSSGMFGDPCPGTLKYLEVQYQCISASSFTATTRKHPSLHHSSTAPLPGNGSSVAPSNKTSPGTQDVVTTTVSLEQASVTTITSFVSTTVEDISPPTTESASSDSTSYSMDVTTAAEVSEKPTTTPVPVDLHPNHCPPANSQGMFWNWTKAGEEAVQKCPGRATGLARWQCLEDTVSWSTGRPSFKECKSILVENLRKRMESGESIISVAADLTQITLSKSLFSEDIKAMTEIIQQTLTRVVNGMENFLDMWHRYHVLRELLQSLLETVSNLLEEDQAAWEDLSHSDRRQVTSSLLDGLEKSAMLLAESSGQDDSFTLAATNVLLSVQVVNARAVTSVHFPIADDFRGDSGETAWIRMEDSLVLPAQTLLDISKHSLAKVVFMAYTRVGELLKPETGFQPLSVHHRHPEEDIHQNVTWIINSRVIAASVGRHEMRLSQPVIITLRHLQEENVTNPLCVFWDFHLREWSSQNCWVQSSNITHTVCSCDHLTNFALVMEVTQTKGQSVHHEILQIIISVGCAISSVCLLIIVVVLLVLRGLKGDRITIHRNLFFCLLLSEVILMGGIDQTSVRAACGVIAAFLDYFLLATLAWTFLECFQLYVVLVEMFESDKSRALWYYALAYSIPGVIVCVAAIIDFPSYGTDRHCWLRADNYFIFSFIGPAVGIFFGGTVFLCVAACILCHQLGITTTVKGKEEAKLATVKSWILRTVLFMCILGLTWTTGLLYLNKEAISLAYAFTVLNCMQGVFILVFYCLTDASVKEELEKCLRNQAWMPACLQKSKGNPPPAVSTPAPGTAMGQHSEVCEERDSQTKQENSSANLISTTPGLQYTSSVNSLEDDERVDVQLPSEHPEEVSSKVPLTPTLDRSRRDIPVVASLEELSAQRDFKYNVWVPHQWQHQLRRQQEHSPYQQYLGSSDFYGPFSEHIYETIEEGSVAASDYGCSPAHYRTLVGDYCYGDRSDLSQHSSSSYGYDQRPLLIAALPYHQAHSVYGVSRNYSSTPHSDRQRRRHERSHRSHRRSASDKIAAGLYGQPPANQEHDPSYKSRDDARDQEGWTLPDLLKCPSDNAVVMAVLDGEKVVSRIQPDSDEPQPHYNLSTYC